MAINLLSKLEQEISSKRIDQMSEESEKISRKYLIDYIRNSQKINEKLVVFLNFSGNFECNVKYIAEAFLKYAPEYELVWGTFEHNHLDDTDNFPKNVKVLIRESYEFYEYLASAKYIFDNSVNMALIGYEKKPEQVLIETWHGAMGIKMFGEKANNDVGWHKIAKNEAAQTDFIISNSELENKVYKDTFWKKTKILKFGHPRNDILFADQSKLSAIKDKILKRYSIKKDTKLCLYAPTFRDNPDLDIYMLNIEKLKAALIERFGGEWVILYRYHDGVIRTFWDYTKYPDDVVNVSDYPDIQELLAVIDLGITDYSSWVCEYVLRKKPGFLYAPDYEEYAKNERKLLFPLESTPFPLATSEDELSKRIKEFDENLYVQKASEFIKKHGNVDNGKAAFEVVNFIKSISKE